MVRSRPIQGNQGVVAQGPWECAWLLQTSLTSHITSCRIVHVYTVSSHLYAQFWTACIPLFASNLILRFVVTQCKTWFTITPTLTFILISLETLCAYMREDTVMVQNNGTCMLQTPSHNPQFIYSEISSATYSWKMCPAMFNSINCIQLYCI